MDSINILKRQTGGFELGYCGARSNRAINKLCHNQLLVPCQFLDEPQKAN